jgi:hypothetical protein
MLAVKQLAVEKTSFHGNNLLNRPMNITPSKCPRVILV